MIIVTTDEIQGVQIEEVLGVVMANSVRAKHLGRDIMAGFPEHSRGRDHGVHETDGRIARGRRAEDVGEGGGDGRHAVVGARFMTAGIASGASEILAYGTAVR